MKKLVFMFICLGVLKVYAQNFPARTDVEEGQLKGKVKHIIEVTKYENAFLKGVDTTFCSFNEKGFITESETRSLRISHQDTIEKTIKKVADYKKRFVVTTIYDAKGKEIDSKTKKLNKKGFLIEEEMIHNKTEKFKLFHSYNPKSSVVVVTSDNKTIGMKGMLIYDTEGRIIIEETYIDSQVSPINKITYTYNNKGFEAKRLIETFFPYENKEELTYSYQYDTQGSATQIKQYEGNTLNYTSQRTIEYY